MGFQDQLQGAVAGAQQANPQARTPSVFAPASVFAPQSVFAPPSVFGPAAQPQQQQQQQRNPAMRTDVSWEAEKAFPLVRQELSQPGAGAGMQTQVANALRGPTQSEQAWRDMQGSFMQNMGAGNGLNSALQSFQANRPELSQDAGLSPYFDNAKARALESINANAAARGAYGSSAALNQGTDAVSSLEGQRALQEAQYGLQRSAENRAWEQLGGDLQGALSADQRGWATAGLQGADMAGNSALQRALGIGTMGRSIDEGRRAQLSALMTAAGIAQTGRGARIGQGFDAALGLGNAIFNPAVGAGQDNLDTYMSGVDAFGNNVMGRSGTAMTEFQNRRSAANPIPGQITAWSGGSGGGGGNSPGGGGGGGSAPSSESPLDFDPTTLFAL